MKQLNVACNKELMRYIIEMFYVQATYLYNIKKTLHWIDVYVDNLVMYKDKIVRILGAYHCSDSPLF